MCLKIIAEKNVCSAIGIQTKSKSHSNQILSHILESADPGSTSGSIYYILGQQNGPPGKLPPGWDLTLRLVYCTDLHLQLPDVQIKIKVEILFLLILSRTLLDEKLCGVDDVHLICFEFTPVASSVAILNSKLYVNRSIRMRS